MTKKKRGHPGVEELLERPWCYYCERDFDDLKVLTSHQKAKHFKCERCGRRLNTAGGLSVHMNQVHKETLTAVENALPNRSDLSVEIFGMEGIPEDIVQQHRQRVLTQFHQAEAERRSATGNPAPGTMAGTAPKKPKVESADDLKKRLAEFRAKKAGQATGGDTPQDTTTAGTQSPVTPQESLQQQTGPPGVVQHHSPPASLPQPPFQQSYGQSNFGMPHLPQQPPPFPQGSPVFPPPHQQYPSGVPQYQQPQFSHPQYQQPAPYGVGSPPPGGFPARPYSGSPSQNSPFARPPSSGPVPGLPSRPPYGGPPGHAYQTQPPPGLVPPQNNPYGPSQDSRARQPNGSVCVDQPSANATSIDDLIANAARESEEAEAAKKAAADNSADKKSKKDKEKEKEKEKDKPTKLIYADNDVSPEEKMAKMSRYAFDPAQKMEATARGDAVHATVAGAVDD